MSVAACAALVQRGDPDRFAAVMAAPPALRGGLFALYAFNLEVARTPWATREPMLAEMRLQWWADAIDCLAMGAAVPVHEVATPLAEALRGLDPAPLAALIEARRLDIAGTPLTDAAFSAYLNDTAGGLLWMAARLSGAPAAAEAAVREFGWAMGLANQFLALPALEGAGRCLMPATDPDSLRDLARRGLDALDHAAAARGQVPAASRPALYAGAQARGVLRRVAAAPETALAGTLASSDFARRGRLLWVALTGRWWA